MTGCVSFTNTKRVYENLREETQEIVNEVLSSGQLVSGPYEVALEKALAEKTNREYVVLTNSGTTALRILARYHKRNAYLPLVSIPAITFPATANAFLDEGWGVAFMDVDRFGNAIVHPHGSDLILPVGLYGHKIEARSCDIGAKVAEDACQSWLAEDNGIETKIISFDPTKNLSCTGNGGAIVTNDYLLYQFAKSFCNHGKHRGEFLFIGGNVRLSELDCAILLSRMKYLDEWQNRRREIARYWMEKLNVETLINEDNVSQHGLQKFVIRSDKRDTIATALTKKKIESKVHYPYTLPQLPHMRETIVPPTTNYLTFNKDILSLPFYPELTDGEVELIADTVNSV